MRRKFTIVELAIAATAKTMDNVARYLTQDKQAHFESECAVVSIVAIKVNVSRDHEFVKKCVDHSVTAIDCDADDNDNTILDVEWIRIPSFLRTMDDFPSVEVLSVD